MPVVKIGDGIGEPEKKCDAGKTAVRRDIHATIEDKTRRRTVGRRDEDSHRRWICGVCAAESRNFCRVRPLLREWMRIGKRGEVVVVKPGTARPAHKLNAFVDIKMILAEIFADQKLRKMLHNSSAELRPCGRNRGYVEK